MQTRSLDLVPATAENIAPFGMLIDVPDKGQALPIAFYEGSVRVYSPATFVSDEDTEISLASIDPRPGEVRWLERHFKHTQTFIPLSGKPFYMVLSPPTENDMPDIEQAKAFMFDGSAGLVLHVGTWHEFPFAREKDTRVVVLLRHEATAALMKDTVINGEGHGDDLDKKDIQVRLGITLTVADA